MALAPSPPIGMSEPADSAMTINDVLENVEQFKPALEADDAEPDAPKPKRGKGPAAKASGEDEPSEEDEPAEDEGDEDTKPDVERPKETKAADNKAAEDAAFSDAALSTRDGVKAAREIVLASRAAAEKRNKILDRYDMRSKQRMKDAEQVKTQANELLGRVEPVRAAIARDLQLFREPGVTAKEKLAALSRLAGGRAAHEIYEELTAGVLADGKIERADPRVEALERQLTEQRQQWETYLQSQQAQQVEGQTAAQKAQIGAVYSQVATAAADAETYPSIADGIEAGDWTAAEVAEMVAGMDGIMVRHHKKTGERLDKSEALRILEARLARRRGGERAPNGAPGAGTTKKPGSPTRGVGKALTITPSADRSSGSRREFETREERLADLARDQAALNKLFPMFAE